MNQYRCETCKHRFTPDYWKDGCNRFGKTFMSDDEMRFISTYGCSSHSDYQSERDTVLDDCCNIDLTEYTRRERESDEVGLCRGRECNYCGRYNAEPRQSKTDPVFISCNTPAHAFRLDLKNEQSERYCLWIEDDDGVYQTSCLHSFEIMNGTPETNGIKFCPYCGKLIRQAGSP